MPLTSPLAATCSLDASKTNNVLRIAFPPYDFLIVIIASFLLGTLLKRTILRNDRYQKGTDKLFPFVVAYLPVCLVFVYVFEEMPIKFYLQDDIPKRDIPQLGPQALPIDPNSVLALIFNAIIWIFCLIVIARHFLLRKKLTSTNKT